MKKKIEKKKLTIVSAVIILYLSMFQLLFAFRTLILEKVNFIPSFCKKLISDSIALIDNSDIMNIGYIILALLLFFSAMIIVIPLAKIGFLPSGKLHFQKISCILSLMFLIVTIIKCFNNLIEYGIFTVIIIAFLCYLLYLLYGIAIVLLFIISSKN